MALRVPPPEVPVVTFLSPNKTDQGLIEFWNTENASYTPLDVGAPHPNSRQYANFYLGNQRPLQGDEKWVIRTWVTNETSPDWFNYALKFAGEDNAYPIFIRTYREPRESYTPRTKAAPLNALYKMVLTENGTGYANGAYPTVQFEESAPSPTTVAVAHGVVAPDGSISECVLDFGGEGYQDDVAFTVQSPINGTPASGIAYRQPVSAILINELANLYPEDSPFYGKYLQVTRVYETLPGPTFNTTKIAEDGMVINISNTRGLCEDITSAETLESGIWCKTTKVPTDSDIVCEQVQECRQVPGNPMTSTRIDPAGNVIYVVRTLKDVTTIVPGETVVSNVWTKTYDDAVSDLVAWEVVEGLQLPGNTVPSAAVTNDYEVANKEHLLRQTGLITPSASADATFVTTVEKGEVSELVSEQITTVTKWVDKALYSLRIPESIIPVEFRASIPTVTESHILVGTASMPTLSGNEFFVAEQQLNELFYERRTESLGDIEFPIVTVGYETTTEYGGGILSITRTLDDSALTVDEGEDVIHSEVRPIGQDLMWFKETAARFEDTEWPELLGTEVDPRTGIVIGITKQVVDAGAVGGVTVDGYIDVKPLDKWRSLTIASKLNPATLPDPLIWETTDSYPFPNTLQGATWLWAAASAGCCSDFAMTLALDMEEGYSGPCNAKITESYTVGPPADVITLTQFFPKGHMVGYAWAWFSVDEECGNSCDAAAGTFSIPPSIHEEITIAGSVILDDGSFSSTLAATVPTALPAPGTLITKEVNVEQWRFGVFYRRIVEIYVPG